MPTMTFTFSAEVGQRLAKAIGRELELTDGNGTPRDATADEVKQWFVEHGKRVVRRVEYEEQQRVALSQIVTTDADIT